MKKQVASRRQLRGRPAAGTSVELRDKELLFTAESQSAQRGCFLPGSGDDDPGKLPAAYLSVYMKALVSILILFASMGIHGTGVNGASIEESVPGGGYEQGRVVVSVGNLRARPSLDSHVVAKLPMGARVDLLLKRETWYAVKHSDYRLAWAHEMLFANSQGQSLQQTVSSRTADERRLEVLVTVGLVREQPTTQSRVIEKIRKGDVVLALANRGEWHAIELKDGSLGWAHKSILSGADRISAPQSAEWNQVKEIRHQLFDGDEERVFFSLSRRLPPVVTSQTGIAPRVICDFIGATAGKDIERVIRVRGSIIREIRVSEGEGLAPRVRVAMDLETLSGADYQIQPVFVEKEIVYSLIIRRIERE